MRRLHLFEILDQRWCPQAVRDGATDFLEAIINIADVYGPIRSRFLAAIRNCNSKQVIDLCSGGGGPWLSKAWSSYLDGGSDLRVVLTDKFPSKLLFDRLQGSPRIIAIDRAVDATAVPEDLRGFRTIFSSFHHFPDAVAGGILRDAVESRDGVASAEVTSRSLRTFLTMFLLPLIVWALTPWIRPFRWSRLLLTYLIPAIPFVVFFDGMVSCFRTRTPEQLLTLTKPFPQYEWAAGYAPGSWLPLVYLIGVPRSSSTAQGSAPGGIC